MIVKRSQHWISFDGCFLSHSLLIMSATRCLVPHFTGNSRFVHILPDNPFFLRNAALVLIPEISAWPIIIRRLHPDMHNSNVKKIWKLDRQLWLRKERFRNTAPNQEKRTTEKSWSPVSPEVMTFDMFISELLKEILRRLRQRIRAVASHLRWVRRWLFPSAWNTVHFGFHP